MEDMGKSGSAPAEKTSKVEEPETVSEEVEEPVVKTGDPTKSKESVKKPETVPEKVEGPVVKPADPTKSKESAKKPEEPTTAPADYKIPNLKAPDEKEEVSAPVSDEKPSAPDTKVPESKVLDEKIPDIKSNEKTPETEVPDEKTPDTKSGETAPETKLPDEKTPHTKLDEKALETKVPDEKTPHTKLDEEPPETKATDVKAPNPKASDDKEEPETTPPETKTPDAKPEVKSPDKSSLAETIVTAVEGALVGAGAAAVKQIVAKSAGDLKSIEDGLQKELVAETKGGLPSFAEIGEDIVDAVETIGEEIVEGAEIIVKEVKAHPELIVEGAVAVAIGVASIIQPELMVGSVAMIGKMAADRAKSTANEIAVEASTHVVNELSKDLNEELAEHAKLEATTTKTDTTKTETSVDEAAGTVTEKKIESSVKETTVVLTGGTTTVKPAEETSAETFKDAKDGKTIEPATGKKGQIEISATSEPAKDIKSDAVSADPVKKVTLDSREITPDTENHSSVVVKSTTKTVSVKIDEDGTITIGTDAPTKPETKTEPEELAKETPKEAEKTTDVAPSKETEPKAATDVSKSLEKKIDEAIEEVKEAVPVEEAATDAVLSKGSEAPKAASPEPLAVSPVKATPVVFSSVVKPVQISASNKAASSEDPSAIQESLMKINQKLDALTSPISPARDNEKRQTPTVDTHTHGSLAQIHQKLDGLIASFPASIAKDAPTVGDTSEKVTPEHLEKIHTKLDHLLEKAKYASVTPAEDSEKHNISETVSKVHIKLDEILLSNAKTVQAAATKNLQDSELATKKNFETLHDKLDKMQEALSIKPKSEEAFVPVHEKMDKIHSAILENAKPIEVKGMSDEAAKTIAQLHEKFEIMQASIDKLATALAARFGGESEPAVRHPAAILTPEPSGISEGVVKQGEAPKDVVEPAFKFPAETPEVSPAVTTGESSETPASGLVTTEPAAKSSDGTKKDDTKKDDTKKDDTKKDDAKQIEESTTPKNPPVKKHVKRSSVFGGWFG